MPQAFLFLPFWLAERRVNLAGVSGPAFSIRAGRMIHPK